MASFITMLVVYCHIDRSYFTLLAAGLGSTLLAQKKEQMPNLTMKQKEQCCFYNWERLHCLLEDAAALIAVSGLVKCKMPPPQPPLGRHSNCYMGCGQQLTGDWVAEGKDLLPMLRAWACLLTSSHKCWL